MAKKSANKRTIGGRKFALRSIDERGKAQAEVIGVNAAPRADSGDRTLLVDLVRNGEAVGAEPLQDARDRHEAARAELPIDAQRISNAEPAVPTIILDEQGRELDNVYAAGRPAENV